MVIRAKNFYMVDVTPFVYWDFFFHVVILPLALMLTFGCMTAGLRIKNQSA